MILSLCIFSLLILFINKYLTSVEKILSQSRNSCTLEHLKSHWRFRKSPPFVPILIQIIVFNDFPSYYFKIHFNISLPCTIMPQKPSLSFEFPHPNPLYISLPPIRAICPTLLTLLIFYQPNDRLCREYYKSLSLLHSLGRSKRYCIQSRTYLYDAVQIAPSATSKLEDHPFPILCCL